MYVLKAPDRIRGLPQKPTVFLAGSIDMGTAVDWQDDFEKRFEYFPGTIYNPRRNDWDSSWKQTESDPQFRRQVDWELDFIKFSDYVFMFIGAESKAPISLLEFGIVSATAPEKLVVCVEHGFYRRGNIEIVCAREDIDLYSDFKVATEALKIKMAARL